MQGNLAKDDKALGREGEALAASFLMERGYKILEKNYRCRLGEVDLIVEKELRGRRKVSFVEVKSRRSVESVSPRELISHRKQVHISRVAQNYLASRRWTEIDADFAVLVVDFSRGAPVFEWIEDAFTLAWGY